MGFILADRVRETSTTTGTGSYALAGASGNFSAFSARMANDDTCYYHAIDQAGNGWEVGIGTWATGNTLARTTILSSSNSDAAVNWSAGTRTISIGLPAGKALTKGNNPGEQNLSVGVPALSSFSWFNQNSATSSEVPGRAIKIQLGADSGDAITGLTRSAPSTPYTIMALLSGRGVGQDNDGFIGLGFTDGTKIQICCHHLNNTYDCGVVNWNTSGSYSGSIAGSLITRLNGHHCLFIADDGTNVSFGISQDGVQRVTTYSVAKASGFLASYTTVGFFVNRNISLFTGTPNFVVCRLWDEDGANRTYL